MTAYEAIVHSPLEYPPWEAFLMLICAGWPMRMAWALAQGGTPVGPPRFPTPAPGTIYTDHIVPGTITHE